MEELNKMFEAILPVYLKGKEDGMFSSNLYLMKKNNQHIYIHLLPEYLSKIEFRDNVTAFGKDIENNEFEPCSKDEFTTAFNEALKVINSKL